VTIPTELREALHLTVGDLLEATIENETMVLTPKVVVDRREARMTMSLTFSIGCVLPPPSLLISPT